jgi:hypothetical protein
MPARAVVEGAAGVMVAPSLSNGAGWASQILVARFFKFSAQFDF